MEFDPLKYDQAHYKRLDKYTKQIDALYKQIAKSAGRLAARGGAVPTGKPFTFDDYPDVRKAFDNLIKQVAGDMQVIIESAVNYEWMQSTLKCDDMVRLAFKGSELTQEQIAQYMSRNLDGLQAFVNRHTGTKGLGLSDRIWTYTGQMRTEIELALDEGIGSGKSADALSRDVRKGLKDPNRVFRRIRDKYGTLVLSKAAKDFHPGQGVYRSSYKNAMRMTRTEVNMAYRTADHLRWQQLDFVVGFEVRLSNRHLVPDICDDLKGRYPKGFKFTGWHPQCLCHCISILATADELDEMSDRIYNDLDPSAVKSVNEVTDTPKGFKDWLANNDERIQGWKSKPYFMEDNRGYVDEAFKGIGKVEAGGRIDLIKEPIQAPTADRFEYAHVMPKEVRMMRGDTHYKGADLSDDINTKDFVFDTPDSIEKDRGEYIYFKDRDEVRAVANSSRRTWLGGKNPDDYEVVGTFDNTIKNKAGYYFFTDSEQVAKNYAGVLDAKGATYTRSVQMRMDKGEKITPQIMEVEYVGDAPLLHTGSLTFEDSIKVWEELHDIMKETIEGRALIDRWAINNWFAPMRKAIDTGDPKVVRQTYKKIFKREYDPAKPFNFGTQSDTDGEFGVVFKKWLLRNNFGGIVTKSSEAAGASEYIFIHKGSLRIKRIYAP